MDVQPAFPITVTFREDGEKWILDSLYEIGSSLEWFDSDDPTENADVADALARKVRLKVEETWVSLFKLA